MDLHPRDVKALYELVNGNIPIIIKANRASDILKLIKIKNEYGLNLVIMGAQEAHLVSDAISENQIPLIINPINNCLLYTSPSPRDLSSSRMPSSA